MPLVLRIYPDKVSNLVGHGRVVVALPHSFYGFSDFFISLVPASLRMLQFLEREVSSWKGLQILDTACGSGALAQALANMGARVTAVECDYTVLAQAMEMSRHSISGKRPYFQLGGIDDLPGEAQSYQMILCLNNALSVLPDEDAYRDFLQKTATLLTPSGRLVLQLFNYDRILDYHDYQLEEIAVPDTGIRVERHLVPDAQGYIYLQSRIQILRPDAFEISNFRSRLWPVRRHQLTSLLKEAGFRTVDFYSDVEGGSWKADSEGTLLVAVRN